MLIGIITGIAAAVCMVILYIARSCRLMEEQKYYDAAHRLLKETCLDDVIQNRGSLDGDSRKLMFYLSWKEGGKQGFVFDPAQGIRIGRSPEDNEICIRETMVSSRQCMLYLAEGRPAIRDCNSANGTWIKRGAFKHVVREAERLYSGDCIMIGHIKIRVKIFMFDLAYI